MILKQHPIRLLLALLLSTSVSAEIYKHTDESGRTVYSDNPNGKDIEAVELPAINTQPAITPKYTPAKPKPAATPSYQITINSPNNETYIPPGQRELSIDFNVRPGLRQDHFFQAQLNGEAKGTASRTSPILLTDLYRGEYQLSVAVIDSEGNIISRSKSVTLYIQRPTQHTN